MADDGMQMCSLYQYLAASRLSLGPPHHPTAIPGGECSRAGAASALVGAAPRGGSVDGGPRAAVMNNNVTLPKADRIVPHSDI